VQDGLVVEKIKHVFDGERQHTLAVGRAEDCVEQVVDKLLQCHLCRYTLSPLMQHYI